MGEQIKFWIVTVSFIIGVIGLFCLIQNMKVNDELIILKNK